MVLVELGSCYCLVPAFEKGAETWFDMLTIRSSRIGSRVSFLGLISEHNSSE